MQDRDLDWGKCVWLCTDQVTSMAGFVIRVQAQK